jgi:predicted DNA binding CopG/RHH family protein
MFPLAHPNSSSKPLKATNYQNEDEEENYLQQKLNKYKSEEKFKNVPKKTKPKKMQKVRGLVAHPTIPKNYPKANTQA